MLSHSWEAQILKVNLPRVEEKNLSPTSVITELRVLLFLKNVSQTIRTSPWPNHYRTWGFTAPPNRPSNPSNKTTESNHIKLKVLYPH
jgi:hypothetical protein